MKSSTIKYAVAAVLLVQCALIAAGVWQIQQESQLTAGLGVFNIMVNIVFGGVNIRTLLS